MMNDAVAGIFRPLPVTRIFVLYDRKRFIIFAPLKKLTLRPSEYIYVSTATKLCEF